MNLWTHAFQSGILCMWQICVHLCKKIYAVVVLINLGINKNTNLIFILCYFKIFIVDRSSRCSQIRTLSIDYWSSRCSQVRTLSIDIVSLLSAPILTHVRHSSHTCNASKGSSYILSCALYFWGQPLNGPLSCSFLPS